MTKEKIIRLGIKNIEIINRDTYNSKNNFFSARKSIKNNEEFWKNDKNARGNFR